MSADDKRGDSGFDASIADPAADLLGMDSQARALADYIRQHAHLRPFTVGVYGEWGEGKTSLVRLMRYHLEHPEGHAGERQPVHFVEFSSWAYNTTEKLWHALVLKIARVLYDREPSEGGAARGGGGDGAGDEGAGGARPDGGLAGRLAGFLAGEMFYLSRPTPERDEYEEILRRLEGSDYGQVRERGAGLNDEAAMSAVIGGAVAALSTFSPLAAGLRSFFGLEPKVELAEVLRKEAGEAAREKVEALARFQETFRDIIGRAQKEPVYIFVDDLDRAQPDVALDIIESIRIALWDARCVFIIAVDSRLIEQGLRMRYKELFKEGLAADADAKGREYLEKIIQFGTRLPARTPEQVRRFIAAQFPEWLAAGDIIEMVGGVNPRRIKQYCQHLTFQRMAGARAPAHTRRRPAAPAPPPRQTGTGDGTQEEEMSPDTQELFDEMMSLDGGQVMVIVSQLGTSFDNLEGVTIGGKIKSLIRICQSEGMIPRLKELIADMKQTPPQLPPQP
jgi:KAP family P-loop domain